MSVLKFYRDFGRRNWGLLACFYLLVNTVVSFQYYMTALKSRANTNWLILFVNEIPVWFLWLLVTPLILFLNFQFPWGEKQIKLKKLLTHLFISFVLVFCLSNIVLAGKLINMGYLDRWTLKAYFPYFGYRFLNDCFIFIFLSIIGQLLSSFEIRRQHEIRALQASLKNNQLNNQLTQAQLQALKLQLSPHFLFNTLNTISSLTMTGQKEHSVAVTQNLSAFLRRTLDFEGEQLVPLQKEIEFFDLYLQIEKARFPKRLQINKEISDDCYHLKVPNLILQPLVENAVKHGIGKTKAAGMIRLKIQRIDSWLNILLSNEGKILDKDWEYKLNVGLANTIERLDKIYGNTYIFQLKNKDDQTGVECILNIPL